MGHTLIMQIIRTYQLSQDKTRAQCSIRTDTDASTFGHFIRLAERAYADFPDQLGCDEIEAVVYGGDTIKRVRGVEFWVPASDVPASYDFVHSLHNHL